MGKWKKKSAEYILQSPWLSVRKDAYETPEGKIIDNFYIVERPDFVMIVPQTEDKKFILVRQYRHGVEDIILNFPMGFIIKGEKPKATAERELFEETGFSGGHIEPLGNFLLAPPFTKTTVYAFMAMGLKENNEVKNFADIEEIDKVVSVSEKELEDLIEKSKLCDLSSVCAYLLMKRKGHSR